MTSTSTTPSDQSWLGRNGWLLAAVWLVFLVFPLLAVLNNDSTDTEVKVASTVLLIAFAGVYVDGFRRQNLREQKALLETEHNGGHWTGDGIAGLSHFAALVALALTLFLVAGVAALGVIIFVVVFAVFHFPWPAVWAVFAGGLAVTALVPILVGRFGELWSLTLIVAAVGGAAMVVRIVEGYQFDQAHLRTRYAISDERSRVARDVHDVLGHSLTAVILKVELCQRLLEQVEPDDTAGREAIKVCRGQLAELDSIGRGALAEIRSTVGGLRAANLADEVTAARTVLADAGVELLVTGDAANIPEGHQSMLGWVVREAVTNIVRHAKAERCHIELAPGPDGVVLRISDDGVGLGAAGEGNGLQGLRERVKAAGGVLHMESVTLVSEDPKGTVSSAIEPATGTRIEVAV